MRAHNNKCISMIIELDTPKYYRIYTILAFFPSSKLKAENPHTFYAYLYWVRSVVMIMEIGT